MHIYNTLSKKKEIFQPIDPARVTMYMCGPTVYNYIHIGNARSFIMADIIRRYLEFKGFPVIFVMNLTDIDDNIIKKSLEEKKSTKELAEYYSSMFFEDLKNLKVKKADVYPKATEHVKEMIDVIKKLEEKGFVYVVDGTVFYKVNHFSQYGKLSGKNLNELESGVRVEINEAKSNPLDFVLWKKAKENEPSWDSPWGKGRPGWHIECSAMSTKHLGESIDIHAGGIDLIFPHHENEIAQSEACYEKDFVKYWLHFGFLNFENEKMSKSLGNFFTARDVLQRYPAEVIRLFFSQTYYGGPLNFSDELLDSAKKGFERISNLAVKIEYELKLKNRSGVNPEFNFKRYYDEFSSVMDDDFNTPQAVAVIFNFVHDANKVIAGSENIDVSFYESLKKFLRDTAEGVLGVIHFDELISDSKIPLENDLIQILINLRNSLKKEKNYLLADQIRQDLNGLGIILEDSKTGTTYKIK